MKDWLFRTEDHICEYALPGGHVKIGETTMDGGWMPWKELPRMQLAGGMENMLRVFLEDTLSEHFFYRENDQWVEVLK